MAGFVLRRARVLDVDAGAVLEPRDVWVDGDSIRAVDPGVGDGHPHVDSYDCAGKIVAPGLIDAHVHVAACTTDLRELATIPRSLVVAAASQELRRMLLRGFTTARDAGGADRGLADAVERGYFAGPRLYVSGLALAQTGGQGDIRPPEGSATDPPGYSALGWSIARVVDGVDQVRLAARQELRRGASQLKIMAGGGLASAIPVERSHFSTAEIGAVVEEAEACGTYVMAHAYSPVAIDRAVRAGVRSIEHGNLLDDRTAETMAGRAYLVPTLSVYEGYAESWRDLGIGADARERALRLLEAGLASLAVCEKHGVPVGFGTDLEGALQERQLREIALRAQVTSAAKVLASATVVNAEMMGLAGSIGVVSEGARADLLVLDGDPLEDAAVLADPGAHSVAIVRAGTFVKNTLATIRHGDGSKGAQA